MAKSSEITRSIAIQWFGSGAALARALGIQPQNISHRPEHIAQWQQDRIRGAAMRLGRGPYTRAGRLPDD